MAYASTPSVAIVVLNWNGIHDTLECLASLLNQTHKEFKIVVIDNGSIDDSVEKLREYQENHEDMVELICNPTNFGFAGGVNTGIEWALNENYDYVALLNNDAVAHKNWLKELIKAHSSKKVGMATGLLLHADGKTIDSTGEFYSTWGLAFPRSRGDATETAPKAGRVFGATGGATLYKTDLLRDIGLFDEDFFAYFEDVDMSFRAQLAGWKVTYTPDAIAYHKQGATSSKLPGFAIYQTFKNLPLLFLKNVPLRLLFPIGLRFYFAYWLMVGNAIMHGNARPALRGLGRSIVLGFKKLPVRWIIQKHKRVDTGYIKSILWDDLPPGQSGLRKLRKFFTGKA